MFGVILFFNSCRHLSITISKICAQKVGMILNESANLIYSIFSTGNGFTCLCTHILSYFLDVLVDTLLVLPPKT